MKMLVIALMTAVLAFIGLIGFVIGMTSVSPLVSAPGTSPADVFHDGDEWYSQDGCWHLQNGYWRPLRRCNIVRVPAP